MFIKGKYYEKNVIASKRVFILQTLAFGMGAVLATQASAQAMLAESDPQASALGYKADATQVDKAKQTKYAVGQICANCTLFQGEPSAAAGGCPLFAGKQVAAKGWCTAYAKKA
jgi:hypothetical protein